ncbi:NADPH-dependent 2,4-dienoyl-CoA reductase/sulfur reductase-like enzyme [Dysgonomonas alginatilytica]|uniref:NADPH-dependent 2,4-dienoyl-CoA reductase/sulfur reductase-like enzyme n=1 Tax=Dysgonomonas alginatilytica TaxID=1605892 RepID=A0A2V3PIG9_9BACT|nr:FAD-dependent oxidoreductase [Dysgonomonas alginatilytica]PXV58440.1 NADPH-dependent 2,4-dienoyl-CoA reductase/sulfur reductase-like enzyme [Dysgonomonas alginatilytica]
MKVLIIGGVAGGATAAARLRRESEDAQIILFERGEYVSYANCGLPYYIGGTINDRDRLFVQTVEGFVNRFNIDIRIKSEVTAIDLNSKTITVLNRLTNESYSESYDKLIVSTGAEPIKPAMPGINDSRIFSLRNVPDMDNIKAHIDQHKPKRAVVIGGGFIGLEMVENLQDAGVEVCVVERANQVMAPIDFSMASLVHQHLKSKNVGLLLGEVVEGFESDNDEIKVLLESKKNVSADMVILSIGVRPEVHLAKDAGLELGSLGGIKVNDYMQTSDPDVYALGDAVEVFNPLIGKYSLIPLAGPANKQARIVADNILEGNTYKYTGTIGTSIAKVFDITVAAVGVSSKLLDRENITHLSSFTHGNSHAGYYPNALPLSIKINFSPIDGKLLGAQIVGFDGVDKRIDLFAQIIKKGGTIYDLMGVEHAYAPPYSSAKDPVNMAGFVADNILKKKVNIIHWREVNKLDKDETLLIDVRTSGEFQFAHIDGAVNIPVDDIRSRLSEISKDKKIVVYCAVGLRGYLASRILLQNGYTNIYNLSGGYKTYSNAIDIQSTDVAFKDTLPLVNNNIKSEMKTITIDACGLQCPGPIMQLKKNYDQIENGDRLEIKVTDQAFGEDLSGWCRMVGANLISINNSGGVVTACIEKTEKVQSCEMVSKPKDNKTLIVFSDDLDKALASFVIANGALASGKKVSMFFTFWGLNVIKKASKPSVKKDFLGKMFGLMLPSSSKKLGLSKMNMGGLGGKMMRYIMKEKKVDTLESLIQQAIDNGVEFIACSMSMDVMGIKQEELMDHATIGGVAAYLDRAENANVNLFI